MSQIDTLIGQCRELAFLIESRIAYHRQQARACEDEARSVLEDFSRLELAREKHREAVLKRWQLRQQLREARKLVAGATAAFFAGRTPCITTFWRQDTEKLSRLWLERSAPLPIGLGKPGIYALFKGTDLVYIGQSLNVGSRIGKHLESKQFTSASYFNVPASDLNSTERRLLNIFRPKLNRDNATMALRPADSLTPALYVLPDSAKA